MTNIKRDEKKIKEVKNKVLNNNEKVKKNDKVKKSKGEEIINKSMSKNCKENKEENNKVFKRENNTLKKKNKKKSNDNNKRVKFEEKDFYREIQELLKNADYDQKNLEQKIKLAWMDTKDNFVNLIRQKNMYNKITLLFNKGNSNTKYEIVNYTIKNILEISRHEYSKQFIITLAKENTKYLVLILRRLKDVSKDIICNKNGLYVMNEIYKMANRKSLREIISKILNIEKINENKEVDIKEKKDINNKGCCCASSSNKENLICKDVLKHENAFLIKKLSSKRLWKYEITHYLLFEYINIYTSDISYILNLFIRNKQINLLLQTYKGLEVCIKILNKETVKEILRIINFDLLNIVNNEYGVIYILKIMELDVENNTIIEFYTENFKEVFINERSILPLLYVFNQERKYYPTLFNQLRTKEIINIDKTYLLSKYKEIIIKNIKIFMTSFSWILVYFFSKKDEEVKRLVVKLFKEIEMNEFSKKLRKKMIKYKLIK